MIVRRPSRLTSPMSAQTLLVPTSMPTRTASRSTGCLAPIVIGLQEVTPDERHVVEDPKSEGDERYQIEVQAESAPDEREQDRGDGVDQETTDEDPIVVDPIQLGSDRSKDGVERRQDRDGGVATELEADVDIEDKARQDPDEESEQGKQHADVPLAPTGFAKGTRAGAGAATR